MNHPNHTRTAREKLTAVLMVYEYGYSVAEVCEGFHISRQTWYTWEKQLKRAVQPLWGGLARARSAILRDCHNHSLN